MLSAIQTQERLVEIDVALAQAANELSTASYQWYVAKRDRETAKVEAYAAATGTATERKVVADAAAALVGMDEEARWDALRLLVRVLEARANIGMSLLRSFGRS